MQGIAATVAAAFIPAVAKAALKTRKLTYTWAKFDPYKHEIRFLDDRPWSAGEQFYAMMDREFLEACDKAIAKGLHGQEHKARVPTSTLR
jgi:hypothetical protein